MSIKADQQHYLDELKAEFNTLSNGKESLLIMLDEAELAEAVYNSNAIENSTLSLKETEQILLDIEFSANLSLREVYEAKNLARVVNYIRKKSQEQDLDKELILLLHKMLLGGINDSIAGRFRSKGEYVRIGSHIAPAPEQVELMLEQAINEHDSKLSHYFLERISKFHLEFEHIHPFCDGNGRIGRVLMNYQLLRQGFPPVIIRDKEKADYYTSFRDFDSKQSSRGMDRLVYLALTEAFHKRLAYLRSQKIVRLTDYAKKQNKSVSAMLNAAKRQTIRAFREKGVWRIGETSLEP
jgi:Fic family protein